MKVHWILLLGMAVAVSAEEPSRRRRRIIVYDQRPSLIPEARPVLSEGGTDEVDRKHRLRRETGLLSGSGPGDQLEGGPLIPLRPLTPATPESRPEEEEEDWITAEDFLSEEDLLDSELPAAEEEEAIDIDITALEDLQQQMIETELKPEDSDRRGETAESRDETMREEAGRFSRSEEEESAGGIGMDPILEQREDGTEAARRPSAGGDLTGLPGIRPVLTSALQLDGDDARLPPPREPAASESALPGSRKLLGDIRSRLAGRDRSRVESSGPAPRHGNPASGLSGPSRPLMNVGISSGFAAPAPMPAPSLPESTLSRPAAPSPAGAPSASQPAPPPRVEAPVRNESRIRSRLGVEAGF